MREKRSDPISKKAELPWIITITIINPMGGDVVEVNMMIAGFTAI